MVSELVIATLLGAVVGGVVGGVISHFVTKSQDERRFNHEEEKKKGLDLKRKIRAYRHLKVLIDRVTDRKADPPRRISEQEFHDMESTVTQDYDVLDETTVAAWDTRQIISGSSIGPEEREFGIFYLSIQFESFIKDVNDHYDQFRYKAIPIAKETST